MTLFERLSIVLCKADSRRESLREVDEAWDRLHVAPTGTFARFFKEFQGSFASQVLGYELFDICDGEQTIENCTEIARSKFNFRREWLVISNLCMNGFLVYDVLKDKVYDVDFDDHPDCGYWLLMRGHLEPMWDSFEAFLTEYFSLDDPRPWGT